MGYSCKFKTPTIKDLKSKHKLKDVFPEENDLVFDMNQKVVLLNTILLNGPFELRVLLLLIFQIINQKY